MYNILYYILPNTDNNDFDQVGHLYIKGTIIHSSRNHKLTIMLTRIKSCVVYKAELVDKI